MLNSFRTLAGSVWAKILLIFLVLSFGVWGIGDMLRNPDRNVAIATAGGEAITRDQFMRALHRETENMRNEMGEHFSPELLKSMNFPRHVLQNMINRKLIQMESEAIGLVPADADVVHKIRSNPAFQDQQGAFDKKLFEATLKNMNISEKNYVEQLRQDLAISLLVDTILASTPVPDLEVKTLLMAREESRSIRLYILSPESLSNLPKPDDAQLKAYYDSHSHEFTAPEYRNISYITITGASVHNLPAITDDALHAAYQERQDEFKHAERRTVDQLLFSSKEKALKVEAALKEGKSFDQVAKEGDIVNKGATSMGKVEKNGIIEVAADAVFSLPVGGYTSPIQSPFGWHIFHVTAVEPAAISTFEEARPLLEKELKQRQTDEGLNKLTVQIEDALAGGASMQEAAHDAGLTVSIIGPVDKQGQSPAGTKLKELPDYDKFLDTAFKTEDKGESPMIMSKGGVFYVLRIDSIVPERLRSLGEVREEALAGWQKEQRAKRLSEIAKEIDNKFLTASGREAVIEKYHPQPFSPAVIKRDAATVKNIVLPPALVNDIFALKAQEGTKAYALGNGDYGLAIVDSVIPASESDPKFAPKLNDIHQHVEATVQNELLEQYTRYLAGKYPVSINDTVLHAVMP